MMVMIVMIVMIKGREKRMDDVFISLLVLFVSNLPKPPPARIPSSAGLQLGAVINMVKHLSSGLAAGHLRSLLH